MITLTKIDEDNYYVTGQLDDDDFFLNTDSEHLDPADAEAGRDAAVYSVPVALKQSVLDELAKSTHILESGVIGSFECTRLLQLVSMRIDAKRTMDDGEQVVTPEACDEANNKMQEWRDGEMAERVGQIKKQLRRRLDYAINENNSKSLGALKSRIVSGLKEAPAVTDAQSTVDDALRELAQAKKALDDANHSLNQRMKETLQAKMGDDDVLKSLPEEARDALLDLF